MKFSKLILLPLVLAAAQVAGAQQAPYVDPALRALLRPTAQQALRSAPALGVTIKPEQQPLALDVSVRKAGPFDVPLVSVFARLRDEQGIYELQSLGGRIGSRIGDIVTAEVPLDQLQRILTSSHFQRFEASHVIRVTNDSSMRAIRADLVRRASGGSWTGTAGRGVIVGIYDTGVDFLHDDFRDPGGNSRVLEVWDQTDRTPGVAPTGMSYGRYCSSTDIAMVVADPNNPGPCPMRDTFGHGTHVAGTAAGDGSAVGTVGTPFMYAGVAPLADIIAVKGGEGSFTETNIIDGLVWLEREGRRLNRPMAVNLSLGGQFGPHDGTRLYEAAIDSLSRAGFIVVVSAGNDGLNANDFNPDGTRPAQAGTYIHGSGPAGISRDFTIEIKPYAADPNKCNEYVDISFWYNAPDVIDLSIMRPDGGIVTAPFGQVTDTDSPVGDVRIDNASDGLDPSNNTYDAEIFITDCGPSGAAPVSGVWTLRVSSVRDGSAKPYHFWMYAQSLGGGGFAIGRQNFDNHYIVSSPGTARRAITAGAFVSKLCWNSPAKPEGPVCYTTREAIGDLARFSSGGPSRDDRIKPEIVAPGLGVASTRSRWIFPAANRVLADGVHWVNQGTSMAAPAVTGTIALLLQGRPTLTPEDVRSIFSQSADHDQFTSRIYDSSPDADPRDWWGYGKLNVCAALSASGAGGTGQAGPVVITPVTDTIPVNATTRFFSCSPTGAAIAFRSSDPSIATVDQAGAVQALKPGTVFIFATSGTFADSARLAVVPPATLAADLRSVAPATTTLGKRGTQLPLLQTILSANGYEGIRVTQLSYRIGGIDPAARIDLVVDANRNGTIDNAERTIAGKTVALSGGPVQVDLSIDSLRIAQRDSVNLIVAVELSGASPNGATFSAEYIPAATRTVNLRSGATNQLATPSGSLASGTAVTTLLAENEAFSLSENPVRSGKVVFNFAQTPSSAGIYTLTGRRVADLKPRIVGSSATWDLTNDDGARVAAGVYFVIFDMPGRRVREKLFVMGGP